MRGQRRSFGVIGVGAAACAACCAVPIAGLIAATGILTVAGLATVGAVGLLLAVPGALLVLRRRRRPSACEAPEEPVSLSLPTRRL